MHNRIEYTQTVSHSQLRQTIANNIFRLSLSPELLQTYTQLPCLMGEILFLFCLFSLLNLNLILRAWPRFLSKINSKIKLWLWSLSRYSEWPNHLGLGSKAKAFTCLRFFHLSQAIRDWLFSLQTICSVLLIFPFFLQLLGRVELTNSVTYSNLHPCVAAISCTASVQSIWIFSMHVVRFGWIMRAHRQGPFNQSEAEYTYTPQNRLFYSKQSSEHGYDDVILVSSLHIHG